MNDLLEAKLTIAKIKTQLLDLVGELIADSSSSKEYGIKRLMQVVEYIEEHDVKVNDIEV